MKWLESRVLWGGLLILGGLIFLLENLGIFKLGDLFWALLLGLAGAFFLGVFIQNRQNWWALIPAFTLFGIVIVIALGVLAPRVESVIGGAIVLGGISASFWAIFLLNRQQWWAIIPGGVLLTLAAIAALEDYLPGVGSGGVFFLGLGVTFALVAVLPAQATEMRWAWIPAGVLAVMGLIFLAAAQDLINYIWPAALIILGGFLVLRTVLSRDRR